MEPSFKFFWEFKVRETILMPVPASYNDITNGHGLRDHVGTVWYDRKFFVSASWVNDTSVWIRFGSVHYEAHVVSNLQLNLKYPIEIKLLFLTWLPAII